MFYLFFCSYFTNCRIDQTRSQLNMFVLYKILVNYPNICEFQVYSNIKDIIMFTMLETLWYTEYVALQSKKKAMHIC